jgi:hypothetical protein
VGFLPRSRPRQHHAALIEADHARKSSGTGGIDPGQNGGPVIEGLSQRIPMASHQNGLSCAALHPNSVEPPATVDGRRHAAHGFS